MGFDCSGDDLGQVGDEMLTVWNRSRNCHSVHHSILSRIDYILTYVITNRVTLTQSQAMKFHVDHPGARRFLLAAALSLTVAACSDNASVDAELQTIIDSLALTGDAAQGRTVPDISSDKAQLGMKLFFTKGLGGDMDSACVTCHHPVMGGGDNLALPVGVGAETPDLLGPGRFHASTSAHYDGGPTVPRNAPTTFNIFLWDRVLFHDGRIESIGKTPGANGDDGFGIITPDTKPLADADAVSLTQAQARFPVTSPEEMKGFVFQSGSSNSALRTALEARLQSDWGSEFTAVYGDSSVTFARISDAIAEYERTQTFTANPWRDYVAGDSTAISAAAKRGALLFFRSVADGGANCASCHSGDFFSDEAFHVLAMPQVGRGKGNGPTMTDDFGRFRETGNMDDMYAFRTPSLLNVEVTGPWSHAGAYSTLEGVVRHHLNVADAVNNYDASQLDSTVQITDLSTNTQSALAKLQANRTNGVPSIVDVSLTDAQVSDLVAFLEALTDPCVEDRACLAAWIPASGDTDPDGLRLQAVDASNNPL